MNDLAKAIAAVGRGAENATREFDKLLKTIWCKKQKRTINHVRRWNRYDRNIDAGIKTWRRMLFRW